MLGNLFSNKKEQKIIYKDKNEYQNIMLRDRNQIQKTTY